MEIAASFNGGGSFTIGYRKGTVNLGSTSVSVTSGGVPFAGFPSGRLCVNVRFCGANASSAYLVTQIDNHSVNAAPYDIIGPKISVASSYGGAKLLGEQVTLPAALASDVLNPTVSFEVSVTDPAGNYVTDVNGRVLQGVDPTVEYTIVLDRYGTYSVRYSASEETFDGVTNQTSFVYSLIVDDDIPPEIVFEYDFVTTAKVGDILVIPDFIVSDNLSASDAITVGKFVCLPSGVLLSLTGNSNSVLATQAGRYEFRIMAVDEAGNICLVKVSVNVTAN